MGMKEGDENMTASNTGNEEIVKLLLDTFNEEKKDQLIEYVMKENDFQSTALHHASLRGHEGIVKLLLNTFNEEKEYQLIEYEMKENEKDKLIEYVMKENDFKSTPLHHASLQGHEGIVKLLLNTFNEEKKIPINWYS